MEHKLQKKQHFLIIEENDKRVNVMIANQKTNALQNKINCKNFIFIGTFKEIVICLN